MSPICTAIKATFDPAMVAISLPMAMGGAYAALEALDRMGRSQGRAKAAWLVGAAIALGLGAWCMHFTAMLGTHIGLSMGYDLAGTAMSLFVVIAASLVGLYVATRHTAGPRQRVLGGLILGGGLAGMHYTGMAALVMPAVLRYDLLPYATSVAIALAAAVANDFFLALRPAGKGWLGWGVHKLGPAAALGAAIVGMHYTAMAATQFEPTNISLSPLTYAIDATQLDALVIAIATLLVLAIALLTSYREAMRLQGNVLATTRMHLAAIVEASDDAIVSFSPNGLITSWNAGAERLYGYGAVQALGRHASLVVPPEAEDPTQAAFERLARGERIEHFETVHWTRDGMRRDVVVSLCGLRDAKGRLTGAAAIVRDATERKRAEQAIARHAAELERANARLEATDQYKDDFLSVISHELRTPLNFITGFASILDDELPGPLNATQHAHVGKILTGAERMLALVNDLLDFAKIQAGKLDLAAEPTAYAPLVDEVLQSARGLALRKGIALTANVPAGLEPWIDGGRVVQVLNNLVSNALKFTPAGGEVALRVSRQGASLLTEVVDTGQGIASDDIDQLFQKFKQLDMSTTREANGTGLGLSITKALVEAHGGTIGLISQVGRGSTFWFTLPLVPQADAEHPASQPLAERP